MLAVFLFLGLLLQAQEQPGKYEMPADQRTGTIHRIFVLCHSHLDIGFTRPPDEVARGYKDNIDGAIQLTKENPDFRWTIESAWMLEEWLRRTPDDALVAELGRMLHDGRMGLGMAFANMHSGLMSAEESNRLCYLGEHFRKRFQAPATVAFANDVPGFTWALPRVLAGSGVKRLVLGLNLFIGGGNNLGVRNNPFYWVGPDGSRVLTYFTYDSYVEGLRWKIGRNATFEEFERTVPRRLAWLEKNGYPYDTYLLMASPSDNIHPMGALPILQRMREWNRKHSDLPMRMVTADEYFDYLASKYGDRFPSASGDAAGYWENVKLKVPEAAARMRQTAVDLPAAETASAIARLVHQISYPKIDLAQAWYALLSFHEHTADSGGGWPGYFSRWDADWSNTSHYAAALTGYSTTEQMLRRGITAMAAPDQTPWLANPTPGNARTATIVVYNGLSWPRSEVVEAERFPTPLREGPISLTDIETGAPVPYEDIPGTKRHIRFYAADVPATGYRAYAVRESGGAAGPPSGDLPIDVTVDASGAITSIRERNSSRELAAPQAARPFGRVLFSAGRDDFKLLEGAASVKTTDGVFGRRIAITRDSGSLPLTEITLYRGKPYADLRFDVDLTLPGDRGSFALSLPVAGSRQTYLDGAGFLTRYPQDLLPGAAPPQLTPVAFVHHQQGDWGVTLAHRESVLLKPDMLYLVSLDSRDAPTRDEGRQKLFRTEPRTSPVQSFHFRIAAQPEDPAQWKRLAAELNLPLRAEVLNSAPPVPRRGFLEVSDPAVQLLTFKPAETSPDLYVLRFQDNGGKGARGVQLISSFRFIDPVRATTTETPTTTKIDLASFSLQPWETLTVVTKIQP